MNRPGLLVALLACGLGVAGCRQPAPTRVNPKDGAEMVLVPAGEFLMGTSEEQVAAWRAAHPTDVHMGIGDEVPQRSVYLDAYYIYKTEVTVAQYRKFCEATAQKMPPAPSWGWRDAHPVVNVTWDDAKAYADWAGVALPTAAQWEKAARGQDGRLFPWGNAWPPRAKVGNFSDEAWSGKNEDSAFIAGYDDGYAEMAPVGSFPAGASPYGALDMAGNAWEWSADWYDPSYCKTAARRNPTGPPAGQGRVVRGGSCGVVMASVLRAASRIQMVPQTRWGVLGFRCAQGL